MTKYLIGFQKKKPIWVFFSYTLSWSPPDPIVATKLNKILNIKPLTYFNHTKKVSHITATTTESQQKQQDMPETAYQVNYRKCKEWCEIGRDKNHTAFTVDLISKRQGWTMC